MMRRTLYPAQWDVKIFDKGLATGRCALNRDAGAPTASRKVGESFGANGKRRGRRVNSQRTHDIDEFAIPRMQYEAVIAGGNTRRNRDLKTDHRIWHIEIFVCECFAINGNQRRTRGDIFRCNLIDAFAAKVDRDGLAGL